MPPVRVRDDTFVYFKDHSTGDAWYERDSAEYHRQRLMIISCEQLAALEAVCLRSPNLRVFNADRMSFLCTSYTYT